MIAVYSLTGETIYINPKAVGKFCIRSIDAKYHICITHIRKGVLWNGYSNNAFTDERIANALNGNGTLQITEVREYD